MPNIEEIMPVLNGTKYFATLYVKSGQWSILVSEESEIKTRFTSSISKFLFTRTPYGVANKLHRRYPDFHQDISRSHQTHTVSI